MISVVLVRCMSWKDMYCSKRWLILFDVVVLYLVGVFMNLIICRERKSYGVRLNSESIVIV